MMCGRDFINAIHIRYGVLFCRAKGARGRSDKVKSCRRGCGAVETLNHILQVCDHTHFVRIKRHDALVNYVQKVAQERGLTVHKEPKFKVGNNVLKPDLVVYSVDRVVVADVQVVSEQYPLSRAHQNKVDKYRPLQDQLTGL